MGIRGDLEALVVMNVSPEERVHHILMWLSSADVLAVVEDYLHDHEMMAYINAVSAIQQKCDQHQS